jgi:dishevelled associated activator of morphogenesis
VQVSGVLEACKEVQRSKRLRKMLEIILAFGNYMNRGQRGNALGFKLNSLTRIADTKSSCNKNMTLLHFMADTCEKKVSVFFAVLRTSGSVGSLCFLASWIRIR